MKNIVLVMLSFVVISSTHQAVSCDVSLLQQALVLSVLNKINMSPTTPSWSPSLNDASKIAIISLSVVGLGCFLGCRLFYYMFPAKSSKQNIIGDIRHTKTNEEELLLLLFQQEQKKIAKHVQSADPDLSLQEKAMLSELSVLCSICTQSLNFDGDSTTQFAWDRNVSEAQARLAKRQNCLEILNTKLNPALDIPLLLQDKNAFSYTLASS